jgi:signal transduction histidine kinase
MMEVKQTDELISISRVLATLFQECSMITDYRTLRDSIPQRLAVHLKCRYVFLYFQHEETLQLVASSLSEEIDQRDGFGWSPALFSFMHANSLSVHSGQPETIAWRERRQVVVPLDAPMLVAVPLIYRQRSIGVVVMIRGLGEVESSCPTTWSKEDLALVDLVAGVVALLLDNSRLLERDRERIYELSLLNSISSQMSQSLHDVVRLRRIVVQRVREITNVDVCVLLETRREVELPEWLPAEIWWLLIQQAHEQYVVAPWIISRVGGRVELSDPCLNRVKEYLSLLSEDIQTLFAMPLYSVRSAQRVGGGHDGRSQQRSACPKVLGLIVAGYYRSWKMRREELALLQILASQVCAAWENMLLMEEIIQARNEAHRLLLQVIDDQRTKEQILESIPSGLVTSDRDGHITSFNRAAATILGYHPYEVLGLSFSKVIPLPHILPSLVEHTTRHLSTLPYERYNLSESPASEQDQTDIWHGTIMTTDRYERELILAVDIRTLYNERGERVSVLTTFNDVTSVHHLEEEKQRLDRLASLGEMAANVAHEVRNPLASIKTSMQMLRDDLEQLEASGEQSRWMQESVGVVLKEVERLDILVRDLLLFSRPCQLHRMQCDLVALCDQVLNLLRPQLQESRIEVHRIYEAVPVMRVDVGQMEQILLNIYKNAIQAMPEGGIITVACRSIASPPTVGESIHENLSVRCSEEPSSRQWVEISVNDTGIGMSPDQLTRVFQPFYTTKAHGIGLGLPITRRLIEDHGGFLRVESQLGYGTTITVQLPVFPHENLEEAVESNAFILQEKK